jgi:hypothetical protein
MYRMGNCNSCGKFDRIYLMKDGHGNWYCRVCTIDIEWEREAERKCSSDDPDCYGGSKYEQ